MWIQEYSINGFQGARRGNYFRGKPLKRSKVGVRVSKRKSYEAAREDEVIGRMAKRDELLTEWI